MEEKRRQIALEDSEVRKRVHGLQEKETMIKHEYEELQKYNPLLTSRKIDIFCIEKQRLDEEGFRLQQFSLKVNEESEVVNRFRASMDQTMEELDKLRLQVDTDKAILRSERMRLEEARNELNTRQKALEVMRFQFVKDHSYEDNYVTMRSTSAVYIDAARPATAANHYHDPKNTSVDDRRRHFPKSSGTSPKRERPPLANYQKKEPMFNASQYLREIQQKVVHESNW